MSLLSKLFGRSAKAIRTPVKPVATPKVSSFCPELEHLESREMPTLMWPTVFTLSGATSLVATSAYIRF